MNTEIRKFILNVTKLENRISTGNFLKPEKMKTIGNFLKPN
jgi:hypothetical protein